MWILYLSKGPDIHREIQRTRHIYYHAICSNKDHQHPGERSPPLLVGC